MGKSVLDRYDTTGSPGRASGEGVGGLEIAATGAEYDASTCMSVSASIVDAPELSGMTIVPSEKLLKIRLTAMMPAAPASALRSAPT